MTSNSLSRRDLVGAGLGAGLASCLGARTAPAIAVPSSVRAAMVGSANALVGMRNEWRGLADGGDPLDAAIAVVKVAEADPNDTSVGLGGLPNEDGVVALDAACMHGPTHNAGAVAALENVLHPSEVARLVMERTDHCLLVGRGAERFARMHGHPVVDLLTDRAREVWVRWKETLSERDDYLPPSEAAVKSGRAAGATTDVRLAGDPARPVDFPRHGTIHCSVIDVAGDLACTTTTSGLAFKVPGRVGDSPLIGAGLYCDQSGGSAGATGRGEAAILSLGSASIVDELRRGTAPLDAGLAILARITEQVARQARWQPALLGADGKPSFDLQFYVLDRTGRWAGVTLKGGGQFAVADEDGVRLVPLVPYL
ncbi:MAG: isoaspartyl peptidase/L-asparaginase [Planctomycetota bacterium]